MRACIYCRYSTDKQDAASIEDQSRLGRLKCEREGWQIVATYSDQEVSGSTPVADRAGGCKLLEAASAAQFDVLVLESLDRLSRDMVEQERVVRRFEYRNIRIVGVSDGYDSNSGKSRKVIRTVRGLINDIYLDDLRDKTHRGLSGRVERGLFPGGLAYGYMSLEAPGGRLLVIDQSRAPTVRSIFEQAVAGQGVHSIAHALNAQKVPSPRTGLWAGSGIYEMIANPIYKGLTVWNRTQFIKDPDTGKRTKRTRPEHEWKTQLRPDLQIVDPDLWEAAQRRQKSRRNAGQPNKTLFGGLLKCGLCGGPVIAVNAVKYGCMNRKERGSTVCEGVYVDRDLLDERMLQAVREDLVSDEALEDFREMAQAQIKQIDASANAQVNDRKARMAALNDEISKLTDAISQMGFSAALAKRLHQSESELRDLDLVPAQKQETPSVSVDQALANYKQIVAEVDTFLSEFKQDIAGARAYIEDLLGRCVVSRDERGVFVTPERQTASTEGAKRLYLMGVAGAGFEPTTFGL